MMRGRGVVVAIALGTAVAGAGCGVVSRKDVLTDAQEAIADARFNSGELTIAGLVDHADTTYRTGEPIILSVTVSKDAGVAILRVLSNGTTTLLFPNKVRAEAAVAANRSLTVPSAGDQVAIVAGKPGVELFEFIASTAKDSWLFKRAPTEGEDFAELGTTTRALAKWIATSLKVGHGPETAAIYVTVRVTD